MRVVVMNVNDVDGDEMNDVHVNGDEMNDE